MSFKHFLLAAVLASFALQACKSESRPAIAGRDTTANNKQDPILAYILSAPVLFSETGRGFPFDSISFDRVIAYEFDGRQKENSRIINQEGEFVKSIKKQKYLNADQVRMITSCLSDTLSYGEGIRPCFAPSEAIVFFNGTIPVMSIDICLDCNFLESSLPIPARNASQIHAGEKIVPGIGFSKKGRACIIGLSQQLDYVYKDFKTTSP